MDIPDLVRQLRQKLGLSQEKFAVRLGVSFKTVNRWENGRTLPSPLAMKRLQELLYQVETLPKPSRQIQTEGHPIGDRYPNLLSQSLQD